METETPKNKIKFKPVHEGMGFHPFASGLPYAPASKAPTSTINSTGAGATAAGRPQFATQKNYTITQAKQNLQIKLTEQKIAAPHEEIVLENTTAISRRRVFAYLLDTVIHAGFWVTSNLVALFLFDFQIENEIFRENMLQFGLFFLVSQWLFIALQEMLFETSLGKSFFNLEFKRNHKSLLLRSIVFMVSTLFFGLGLYFKPQDTLGQLRLKNASK